MYNISHKFLVITLSIVVIILAVDYNNSKYAKGIFFRYHFLSENILMLKMDGETMYYTYFSEDDKSAKNNNILYLLFEGTPPCMPIFKMTECVNVGIQDSCVIGYSLVDNQVVLSVNDDSLLNECSCSVYDEVIKLSDIRPQYDTSKDKLNHRDIILAILCLVLIGILILETKTYTLFYYIFATFGVLLRLFFDFDGYLWVLHNYFIYLIQLVYLISLPIMMFRAYKNKDVTPLIPLMVLNILLIIYTIWQCL